MSGFSQNVLAPLFAAFSLSLAQPALALVFCVTNAVDEHQAEPAGELAGSGWRQTVLIGDFLGTVIHSNALLTAEHLKLSVGQTFECEGQTRQVTATATNAANDLAILFFEPAATNIARLNIETNDIASEVVLQGRGMERGAPVVTDGRTNGWEWGDWRSVRRWGKNRYHGEAGNGVLAIASFDNNGDADECMLSPGDSGGPGFIRTGSGWKLATVNYAVDPDTFLLSTNAGQPFHASLYDCAGLHFFNAASNAWQYVPPQASPAPCLMLNTRTSQSLGWITNTVPGITFPADIGVSWRCETATPSAGQAAAGLCFETVATNAGPYAARGLSIELEWGPGLRIVDASATQGTVSADRWLLPLLADGGVATALVHAVVWRSAGGWVTNRATVSASDKPDGNPSNNTASAAVLLPATATFLLVQ